PGLVLEGSLHAAHRSQSLWHSDVRHQMHEAFCYSFFAHSCNLNGGFDVPGQLRFYTAHGSKSSHVQHLAVTQFDAFALVGSAEYGFHDPIGRTRRELIQLLLPGSSTFWGLRVLNKLIALVLAQFHSHLLLIRKRKSHLSAPS